ncbi:MAG: hypothetical protein QOH38_676 [Thermoleophilaceae bacterium]|nr:hypothetical protein [Thermoleophilaceae bacterium]MEA2367958.1 hypothetical protein [Thermoleophilaceae bacterium]
MPAMARRILVLALAATLAVAGIAIAAPPRLKLNPKTIHAGDVLKVTGTPGGGCEHGDTVTIYSKAFPGGGDEFAGVPAIHGEIRSDGHFAKHVRIPMSKHGDYSVGGRCNGGNFAHRTLHVLNP